MTSFTHIDQNKMLKSNKRNNACLASPVCNLTALLVKLKSCFAFDFLGIHQIPEISIWDELIRIKFSLDINICELDKFKVPSIKIKGKLDKI